VNVTVQEFESRLAELTANIESQLRDIINRIDSVANSIPSVDNLVTKQELNDTVESVKVQIETMATDVAELKINMDDIVNIEIPDFVED
jgi:DNA-binding FrmR family transcriptional regulator